MVILRLLSDIAIALVTCGVAWNGPKYLRPYLFMIIVCFAGRIFRDLPHADLSEYTKDFIAKVVLVWTMRQCTGLLLEDYRHVDMESNCFKRRMIGTYKTIFNTRFVGPDRTLPDVQYLAADDGKTNFIMPKHPRVTWEQRSIFVAKRLLLALVLYYLEEAEHSVFERVLQIKHTDYYPPKDVYFRRLAQVTLRETIFRIYLVFKTTGGAYALYTKWHSICSCFFVGIGLDEPEEWPPLFGSFTEAYSVGRMWSKYFDRIVYRTFATFARCILRVPLKQRLSLVYRHAFIVLVFAFSGAFHGGMAVYNGFSCAFWPEFNWYMLNCAAVIGEMAVQVSLKKYLYQGREPSRQELLMFKTLGFCWVFLFLFWSIPKAQFPWASCMPIQKYPHQQWVYHLQYSANESIYGQPRMPTTEPGNTVFNTDSFIEVLHYFHEHHTRN